MLFVLGCFRYESFGMIHRTEFCEFYYPQLGVWRMCSTGNSAN
jgi:hypothetical protein